MKKLYITHHFALCFLLIPLLVFSSCEDKLKGEPQDEKKFKSYTRVHSIDTDLVLWPRETFVEENQIPSLELHFQTTKIYPCINFGIAITEEVDDYTLIVRFDSIIEHEICLTALGPASARIPLSENIQKLVLVNGEEIDSYNLHISDEKVSLTPADTSFTQIEANTWFRYPENSFAFICGTNTDNTFHCGDFSSILLDSLNIKPFSFDGEGVIPYPISSSGHWNDNSTQFFTYENIEEFEKAGTLLKAYTMENIIPNSGVTLQLVNWKNQYYRSWMMQ